MRRTFRFGAVIVAACLHASVVLAAAGELASASVQTGGAADSAGFDGVVEAVRQTVLAAQVPGGVVELAVKVGDTVRQGQVLLRIDARAAAQNSAASAAQVQAARSALDVATRDYERQRQLFQKQYISQAALERAEAQFRASSAQLTAQSAQASAAHIQSDFFVVKAPYAGVIADLPVALGDMAMPGRPLLTLYDPAALRVTAPVPQTALARLAAEQSARVELPGLPAERQWLTRLQVQVLPTIDVGTHSAQVRINLPGGIKGVTPGMFARVWLPTEGGTASRLYVPAAAIVRRAEMTGLYVIDSTGRPALRQVRLGRTQNDLVEVLAGVAAGERVALDPQAAAKDRR
ncbi:MAG: efflux RND transporter periplasmic adaptor subunit [Polaromonas sp.]|uniref:efflux RND transporter periplasmic adaptor subunit n=1 Tax=Polaromonas sp. TaxID=1869339 RepID=UPI0027342D23|nr:efflux RND transporter periplasmic adaptor subunit [Polaromonas sp.]MDP2816899.1 efflux RND transporter periplasmic adaptor subunit [Polaromonas sp.]